MKILFTGGGTGGHIFPVVAIIRALKKNPKLQDKNLEIYYIGPKDKFATEALAQEGVKVKTVMSGKLRRYLTFSSIFQNIFDLLFRIPIGTIQAYFLIKKISPLIIFSKGGYGSLPVVFANRILKIPMFLHESDSVSGLANRMSTKSALKVFTSFPTKSYNDIPAQKKIETGNPLRKGILGGSREEGIKLFNLIDDKPVILFLGGSQGAEKINQLLLLVLEESLKNFEIIHQCGKKNFKNTKLLSQAIVKDKKLLKYYHLKDFLSEEEMRQALAVCHLVVSRAGAGAITEIAAAGKPSILVPLAKSAQNHQIKNAYLYAQTGAAIVMEPSNPTPHLLYSQLMFLFSHHQELKKMGKLALKFARPNAAEDIATHLAEYLNS